MRANITYAVDVDDIPQEVVNIVSFELERLQSEIADALFYLSDAIESEDYLSIKKNIEIVGQSLQRVDTRLMESSHIVTGYIDHLNAPVVQDLPNLENNEASPDLAGLAAYENMVNKNEGG